MGRRRSKKQEPEMTESVRSDDEVGDTTQEAVIDNMVDETLDQVEDTTNRHGKKQAPELTALVRIDDELEDTTKEAVVANAVYDTTKEAVVEPLNFNLEPSEKSFEERRSIFETLSAREKKRSTENALPESMDATNERIENVTLVQEASDKTISDIAKMGDTLLQHDAPLEQDGIQFETSLSGSPKVDAPGSIVEESQLLLSGSSTDVAICPGTGQLLDCSIVASDNKQCNFQETKTQDETTSKTVIQSVNASRQHVMDNIDAPSNIVLDKSETVGFRSSSDEVNGSKLDSATSLHEGVVADVIVQGTMKTEPGIVDDDIDITFGTAPLGDTTLHPTSMLAEASSAGSLIPETVSLWPTLADMPVPHPSQAPSGLGFEDDPDSENERPQRPTLLHEIAARARQTTSRDECQDSVMAPWRREHRIEVSHASEPPNFDACDVDTLASTRKHVVYDHADLVVERGTTDREHVQGKAYELVEESLPFDPDVLASVPFSNEDERQVLSASKAEMHASSKYIEDTISAVTSAKQSDLIVEPAKEEKEATKHSNLVVDPSTEKQEAAKQINLIDAPAEETKEPSNEEAELLDDNDTTYADLDDEELEDHLLRKEAELRQMRADFEVRVKRCSDLRKELQEKGGNQTPATLRKTISKLRNRLQASGVSHDRAAMGAEDFLEGSRRLLLARDKEISFLERKMHSMQQKHQRLVHSREPVSDEIAQEALKEKKKQFDALSADCEAQDTKITSLCADLKSVLDFIMRVNIEALGGPASHLTAEDFLPQDVREHLQFTKHTQAVLLDLVRKYDLCMAQCREKTASSSADPRKQNNDSWQPGVGQSSSTVLSEGGFASQIQNMQSDKLPVLESVTRSFGQEAKLLRKRFADEMQKVAGSLADDDSSSHDLDREAIIVHEILRASAWGDEATLRDLLPMSGRSLEKWQRRGDDSALLGWTPWHAAAAHGQAATLGILREITQSQGGHMEHAQGQLTVSGLPPLAVACLRGHVEVVRSLLAGMAPIHVCDSRGNSALHWAGACGVAKASQTIHQLLISAGCNPETLNHSGQCAMASSKHNSFTRQVADSEKFGDVGNEQHAIEASQPDEKALETYFIIEAVSLYHTEEQGGFFQSALNMLKVPVRDEVGFGRNDRAKTLANLNLHEADSGVFSDWVINYTHAGLQDAIGFTRPDASPIREEANQQAVVLTSERLLFFNVACWTISLVLHLEDLTEVAISPQSKSMLVIRAVRHSDTLLDIANRSRFLTELQVVAKQVPKRFNSKAADEFIVPIRTTADLILTLSNDRKQPLGTCGFVEMNMFLLLPYVPSSILLSGPMPTFFGFLDVQRMARAEAGNGAQWKWQSQFFVLKVGLADQRMLLWCHSPIDIEASGKVQIDSICRVQSINSIQGEPCIVINYAPDPSTPKTESITLRAKTSRNRDEWASCLKALWGNTRSFT